MLEKVVGVYGALRDKVVRPIIDHIIEMNNHHTISVYCGDKGEEPHGRYNIKIRVVSKRFPRRANVSCKKFDCSNTWCGYFDGNTLTTRLERDQIEYLAKKEKSDLFIDPKNRPYYIEKL